MKTRIHTARKAIVLFLNLIMLGLADNAMANTYTTHFPLTENPISEGGNWINGQTVGLDWNNVKTANGIAMGASTGSLGYNDPTALLTGIWGPNQSITATVEVTNRPPAGANFYGEVELRLRSALSAHTCTGYEVNFSTKNSAAAYVQIVRWNGPLENFTYLASVGGAQCIVNTGNAVTATITGNTIRAYINGIQVCQATDSTYASGNPGMGFYYSGSVGSITDYGFTDYTATDGGSSGGGDLWDAVTLSATVYQSDGAVKQTTLTQQSYIAAVSASTGVPQSDLVVVLRELNGEVAVFRNSTRTKLYTIITPPGINGSATNYNGTDTYATGIATIASTNTTFSGFTFAHISKSSGGSVNSETVTYSGGTGGQVIQGTCNTTGSKFLY